MNKINFIYIRSLIGNSDEFKNQERDRFLMGLNSNNDFEFSKDGENIFFIETGGTEEKFRSIYLNYKEPYYLLATDANNSLPACLEIATFLRNNNKEFKIIHGTPNEVRDILKNLKKPKISGNCRGFLKKDLLKGTKFGVIGKPSDWLIASNVDYLKAKEKLGATLVDIDTNELVNEVNKISDISYHDFEYLLNEKINKETLVGALKIYEALKAIIARYQLDGITVRCFDLLGLLKNTSCLALAMLNKEGIIATCEGDVPAMLSMALVKKEFNESSFQVNPSYLNLKERYGYFAHCTIPLDMCKDFSFDTHFESGIGIGIKGELDLTKITIFKMNADLIHYEIFEGSIVSNLDKNNLCRTQIKVSFDASIDDMFDMPNGNHLVIFYGAHKEELVKMLSN